MQSKDALPIDQRGLVQCGGKWLSQGLMDLFSPSGHGEALDPYSLNLIQSVFVPLEGKEIEEKGTDPLCLRKIKDSVTEK